jgi:hypothetical protein
MPVSTRKQLFELPDGNASRVATVFYADARDALLKALNESPKTSTNVGYPGFTAAYSFDRSMPTSAPGMNCWKAAYR